MTTAKMIHLHTARSTRNGFECSFMSVNKTEVDSALDDLYSNTPTAKAHISDYWTFSDYDYSLDVKVHKFINDKFEVDVEVWEIEDTSEVGFIQQVKLVMKQTILEHTLRLDIE